MTISARLLLVLALLPEGGAPAGPTVPIRWSLEVKGIATIERGELRLDGHAGRILLENSDSAFQLLVDFRIVSDSIHFTVPKDRRRFSGVVRDTTMEGVVQSPDGGVARWRAVRLAPGADFSPVDRRFLVRQLVLGADKGSVRVPGAWMALLRDPVQLDSEYRVLARAAALPVAGAAALAGRPRRIALGLDSAWRAAECALIGRIGAGPAGDALFRRIFATPSGCRLDLFDVATEQAAGHDRDFQLERAVRALSATAPVDIHDSASIREAAWTQWSKSTLDNGNTKHAYRAQASDPTDLRSLRALFAGYDDAVRWWQDAVHWLLTRAWLDTPAGARSPAQLVATFWGADSLALPVVVAEPYGDFEAFPVIGAAVLGSRLVRPLNASAAERVRTAGIADVIEEWSGISFGSEEEPLPVAMGGKTRYVMSPAAMNFLHGGSPIAGRNAIRLDPGITPLIAVATIIHEWQHIIIGQRRLGGLAPGVVNGPNELRLLADDPWLSEGAAEWASEESLRPARNAVPLLALFDAEKRRSLAATAPDDPHPFGYRLVRAAAEHSSNATAIAGRLVRLLHDLPAFAIASGLGGASGVPARTLDRPTSTTVIPEITFVMGGPNDYYLHPTTHRLLISTPRPEP